MSEERASGSGELAEVEHGEEAISLNEYIEAEKDLEDDALAVLGGSDTGTCTYSQGYVQRQAIYSCATCTKGDDSPAGICLACSLDCHDGHDLYELYTKRCFRCDCGNSGMDGECKLQKDKDNSNPQNKYNHNFRGLYCSCDRPYPDPDNEEEGEMIQCCVCEDWYHDIHLQIEQVPTDYEEMVCVNCAKRHSFLLNYPESGSTVRLTAENGDKDVDVTSSDAATITSTAADNSTADDTSTAESESADLTPTEPSDTASVPDTTSTITSGARPESQGSCKNLSSHSPESCRTLFMSAGWRQSLCTCTSCRQHYKTADIEYLLDEEDPTHVYEQKAKSSGGSASNYEKGMDALSNLGRVQQIELLSGYNDMKTSLADYLKGFASSNKVVKADDIKEFFEEYSKSKRRRLAVPPSTCS